MFAYTGGYTTPDRDGRGDGINAFRVDPATGAWAHLQTVGGLENPALFVLTRDQTRLYAVHGARGLLSAFRVDRVSGRLGLINQADCGGRNPVDLALDPSERFLVVANYGTGAVAVVPLAADGALLAVSQAHVLEGVPGPDPVQQASSHPHAVIFDPSGEYVIVPDKGFDRTFLFRFLGGRLVPTAQGSVASAAGAAPRHAVFHPALPVLYVNNELDSTVTVFDWADGAAFERQVVSSRPVGAAGKNTTAEIAVAGDGRYLYVSNRGDDSIARFGVAADGGLSFVEATGTGGLRPRFFAVAPGGRVLYAANQDSDTICGFAVDAVSGALSATGFAVAVGSPSAISFVSPA